MSSEYTTHPLGGIGDEPEDGTPHAWDNTAGRLPEPERASRAGATVALRRAGADMTWSDWRDTNPPEADR